MPLILLSEEIGNQTNKQNYISNSEKNSFIENKGQWNPSIKFLNKAVGFNTIITGNNIIFDFYNICHIENTTGNFLNKRIGQVIGMRFEELQKSFIKIQAL